MSDLREQNIKELAEIIKECGSYSEELDGYVINPTTVACKIQNAGYHKSLPELPLLSDEEKFVVSMVSKYPYKDIKDVIEEASNHERYLCQRTLQEYLQNTVRIE